MNDLYPILKKTADWQMSHPGIWSKKDWTWAALLTGMTEWSRLGDKEADAWLLDICGKKNKWRLLNRFWNPYHADDHAVGWTYIELYRKYGDEDMIRPLRERLDWVLEHPSRVPLDHGKAWNRRYSWSDALFMAPPVLMNLSDLTGDSKYRDFANREWWETTDFLYDREEKLFYRDSKYFSRREKNGARVFWGRGNAWVLGALPRILKYLPEDHPDRERYISLYREMAERVVSLQGENGWWTASLLDTDKFPSPETSATGLFCYSLLAGVNRGFLDKSYLTPALKSWDALKTALHPNGKLGWVQPIGENPKKSTAHTTDVFGVGAFLLAGTELYSLNSKG